LVSLQSWRYAVMVFYIQISDICSRKACKVLSFATRDKTSSFNEAIPTDMIPLESDLVALLHAYPREYSLDCAATQPEPSTDDFIPPTESATPEQGMYHRFSALDVPVAAR
jgi:hypothetical protein